MPWLNDIARARVVELNNNNRQYEKGYIFIININRRYKEQAEEAIEILGYEDKVEIRETAYNIRGEKISDYISVVYKEEYREEIDIRKYRKLCIELQKERDREIFNQFSNYSYKGSSDN